MSYAALRGCRIAQFAAGVVQKNVVERGALHRHSLRPSRCGCAPRSISAATVAGPSCEADVNHAVALRHAGRLRQLLQLVDPIRRRVLEFRFHDVGARDAVFELRRAYRAPTSLP